jgi:type II secretory pathway pseudopilin PulG
MPSARLRRLVQGQGGSTLIELLVAMPIAIVLLGLVVQSLGTAGRDQQDIERRTDALTNGQIGLERMTRELRQATWLYFRSSSVVDINVKVRATPTSTAADRLVRFDCSGDTCERSEGPPVIYPPPASPTFAKTATLIGEPGATLYNRGGQLVGHDVFRPRSVDPATGASTTDFADPDFVLIRLQLSVKTRHATSGDADHPLTLEDGVSLRNRSTFA